MAMDGLGGDSLLQSKTAIVSPATRPDADVDYTFVQIFPDQRATLSYKMNCGNISSAVPVFALMKDMIPDVADGTVTVRTFSTNTGKMMYMTLDVLNGEARVAGQTAVSGVPGTGAEVMVDFRDLGGGFTGKLFPTGNLADTITMDEGSSVDVAILDLANLCVFFDPASFPNRAVPVDRQVDQRPAQRLEHQRTAGWTGPEPAIPDATQPVSSSNSDLRVVGCGHRRPWSSGSLAGCPAASATRDSRPSLVIIFWMHSTFVRSTHSTRQGTSGMVARTSWRAATPSSTNRSPSTTWSGMTSGGRRLDGVVRAGDHLAEGRQVVLGHRVPAEHLPDRVLLQEPSEQDARRPLGDWLAPGR